MKMNNKLGMVDEKEGRLLAQMIGCTHTVHCTLINVHNFYKHTASTHRSCIFSKCITKGMKHGFDVCSTYVFPVCGHLLVQRTGPPPLHSRQPNALCTLCTA